MNEEKQIGVERGVPLPCKHKIDWPFYTMKAGESFFTPKLTNGTICFFRNRMPTRKFQTRTVTENGIKGVRVWRTK